MAITDVPAFAHLTDADIENLAVELDAIRQDIEDSRGERDARYIRNTIAAQRALEVTGRVLLAASSKRSAWWAGTVTLARLPEFNKTPHDRGILSMARGDNPASATSSFFIVLSRQQGLDNQYTVFGKVLKGQDVVGRIQRGDILKRAFVKE
mgnify:CR=1 FL=1